MRKIEKITQCFSDGTIWYQLDAYAIIIPGSFHTGFVFHGITEYWLKNKLRDSIRIYKHHDGNGPFTYFKYK